MKVKLYDQRNMQQDNTTNKVIVLFSRHHACHIFNPNRLGTHNWSNGREKIDPRIPSSKLNKIWPKLGLFLYGDHGKCLSNSLDLTILHKTLLSVWLQLWSPLTRMELNVVECLRPDLHNNGVYIDTRKGDPTDLRNKK